MNLGYAQKNKKTKKKTKKKQKNKKKKTNKQTNKVEKECLRLSGCGLRGVIYELGRAKLHAEIWQSNKSNKIFKGVGVCVCLWG